MAGPVRLFVLDLGRVESDLNWILPQHAPATADDPQRAATWTRVPTLAFLIEHDEAGWMLFDTGCHPRAMDGHLPPAMADVSPWLGEPHHQLPEQLARCGVVPADIAIVALSHLHFDHAGGLTWFAGLAAGRNVVVHEDELAWALLKTHERGRRARHGYVPGDFCLDGVAFDVVRGDRQLAAGVELLALPGHTPGSMGLLVDLPGTGPVVLPSDSVYTRTSYGPPLRPAAAVHDSRALEASVDRLRELERRRGAALLFSHDWEQYEHELRLAPESYA